MARPGQKQNRRARAVESASSTGSPAPAAPVPPSAANTNGGEQDEYVDEPPSFGGQVLPVAELDDDFDGEALDGATYLALANRENATLPFTKRVAPPGYCEPTPKAPHATSTPGVSIHPVAGGSTSVVPADRHPALPRESWGVVFAAHFRAYRARLATRWPPKEKLPYPAEYPPLPRASERRKWLAFIDGPGEPSQAAGRADKANGNRRGGGGGKGHGNQEDEEAAMNEETAMNEEAMAIDDEEAAMNEGGPTPIPAVTYREPLISVVQGLNTHDILQILSHLSWYTSTTLDRLDWDDTCTLDPLPPSHARWSFALLAILDAHLASDQMSELRDFARVAAAVAAWRWQVAVSRGDVPAIKVYPGFYRGEDADTGKDKDVRGEEYALGARWKLVRDTWPRSLPVPRPESKEAGHDDTGLDEGIARAWVTAHAVVAGWAQWDLVDDFERAFRQLPAS